MLRILLLIALCGEILTAGTVIGDLGSGPAAHAVGYRLTGQTFTVPTPDSVLTDWQFNIAGFVSNRGTTTNISVGIYPADKYTGGQGLFGQDFAGLEASGPGFTNLDTDFSATFTSSATSEAPGPSFMPVLAIALMIAAAGKRFPRGGLMTRFGKHCFAVLTALMFTGMASASTLVVNCTTVSGPTELGSSAIVCPKFNLAETLSDIQISVSGAINGAIQLANGDNVEHNGFGTTTTDFNFGALSGFTFGNPVLTLSFTTGVRTLHSGETLTVSGLSAVAVGSLGDNTTTFAPYSGFGNFAIPVATSTGFSGGGGGGFFQASQFSTNANASADVIYTYGAVASVPEPTTLSLLGIGLLGLGFIARKLNPRSLVFRFFDRAKRIAIV